MAEFPTFKGSWPWPWPWIGSYCIPSCNTRRPLPTYQISLKSNKLFWTDGRTYVRTDGRAFETHFIRSRSLSKKVLVIHLIIVRVRHSPNVRASDSSLCSTTMRVINVSMIDYWLTKLIRCPATGEEVLRLLTAATGDGEGCCWSGLRPGPGGLEERE